MPKTEVTSINLLHGAIFSCRVLVWTPALRQLLRHLWAAWGLNEKLQALRYFNLQCPMFLEIKTTLNYSGSRRQSAKLSDDCLSSSTRFLHLRRRWCIQSERMPFVCQAGQSKSMGNLSRRLVYRTTWKKGNVQPRTEHEAKRALDGVGGWSTPRPGRSWTWYGVVRLDVYVSYVCSSQL